MDVQTNESRASIDPNVLDEAQGKIKQKFGQVRRRIKQIDLRETVIDNPFAAVGIGLAAGALVGLLRPRPQPGRVTSAFVTVAGMLAYRFIKDAAFAQLGSYAKDFLRDLGGEHGSSASKTADTAPF